MSTSARCNARMSGVWSPVNSNTLTPSSWPNLRRQSASRSRASALSGATYTALVPLWAVSMRMRASSAVAVLPEPVGAPTSMLVSVWYATWNTCVWMGLKWVNGYSCWNAVFFKAVTGSGCRSSKSVCGGWRSGSIKCRKLTGQATSAPNQRSEMARTQYCVGSGSKMGTVKMSS